MMGLPQDPKSYSDSKALTYNEEFGVDADSRVLLLKCMQKDRHETVYFMLHVSFL